MIGYHAVPVIVDAYMKGDRNFDIQEAYRACVRAAEYDTTGIKCPDLVLPHLMPKAKYYKNSIGYVPCDRENESVAKALEYAYDDWCISVFADALNDYDTGTNTHVSQKPTSFTSIREPALCADWTVRANGALPSIHALQLTATMIIVKGLPGNGPGSFHTTSKDW